MKKTMMMMATMVAMASGSMGAELIANWDDFTSMQSSVGTYTMTTRGSTAVSDGVLNVVGAAYGGAAVDLTSSGLKASDGLTVNMAVSNVGSFAGVWPHTFVSLATSDQAFYTLWGTNTATDTLKAAYNGSASKISTGGTLVDFSAITGNEPVVLTMTFTASEMAIYVNGELGATATVPAAQLLTDSSLKQLGLGGWCGDSSYGRLNESVHSLSIYSGAMTAEEVKALVAPEPATATLSLLALAGLAARRRRH